MAELSTDERRYLLAAFDTSPEHWFRAKVVGRHAAFADRRTSEVILSLAWSGLMDVLPDHTARLTALGRVAANRLLEPAGTPRHLFRRHWWALPLLVLAGGCGTCAGIWWLANAA